MIKILFYFGEEWKSVFNKSFKNFDELENWKRPLKNVTIIDIEDNRKYQRRSV